MEDKTMMRIAITPEVTLPNEPRMVTDILTHGWDMVHLRHPGASLRDMRNLIEAIPQKFHPKLRLHGHFELLSWFNLGGVHLNRRCPELPSGYNGLFSRSCHSLEEFTQKGAGCDYVTLSPVFDSISKAGYTSSFTKKDLNEIGKTAGSIVNTKVIALGGITSERVQQVKDYGFDGYAVLGALMGASYPNEFLATLKQFDNLI